MAALNDLIQVGEDGSGVGLFSVIGIFHIPEPGVDVLLAEFVDVRVAIDFNVVFRLDDIHAIEHIEEALSFQWYTQHVVDGI